MLISLRWLRQLLPNDLTVGQTVEKLTMAGLEVESTLDLGMGSGRIVVAKVLETSKHPDADKLSLVKADAGTGETLDIVCGAPNVRPGILVPCALPGAELPGGFKIKKSKIRGVESNGMLCSAKELNLGGDHGGILELPETFKPGEPFDCILEIKVTPNRADCLSMTGVARDLAAMIGRKKTFPSSYRFTETMGLQIERFLGVEVEDRTGCPRYTARFIKDVKVGPSPLWLARALEAAGLRPINNVVDVTNYVMLELGFPLHAFDHAHLDGGKIVVRRARAGESIETLDGTKIALDPADLVIADGEKPVALAGVMGGRNSQVTEGTTRIVIEAACFNPSSVRATARRHGLSTDSSYRFERGVDRANVHVALARATQLIHELAKGEIARGQLDVQGAPVEERLITLDLARMNHILGLNLSRTEVADRLAHLDFEIRRHDAATLTVLPPSYRMDMQHDVDLIEEIARLTGYENIPETMPGVAARRGGGPTRESRTLRRVRGFLADSGLSETVHYSFTSEAAAGRHGFDPAAQPRLANPLTLDQVIMRPSLLPGLLATTEFNQRQGAERVAIFETGKIFPAGARPGHEEDERHTLAIVLAGSTPSNWAKPGIPLDFFDLKGLLEGLAANLGLDGFRAETVGDNPVHHPGRGAKLVLQGREIGLFGEIHPDLAQACDLKGRVLAAELDLGVLLELAGGPPPLFKPIPRLPGSQRDLAVLVDASTRAEDLVQAAIRSGRPMLEEVQVIDLYTGKGIPEGRKSITLRLKLRAAEATLTEDEITGAVGKVMNALAEKCGAERRG